MIIDNNHSNEHHRILHQKYRKLDKHKMYAIKKAMRKFDSIPLEIEDLEHAAWNAFLEVERKYNSKQWKKSYENFFIDCVFWKAKDYCKKFISNKHKLVNHAVVWDFIKYDINDFENNENQIIKKLTIRNYIDRNLDNEKGQILEMLISGHDINSAIDNLPFSRSKVYRIIRIVRSDLKILLDI